MRRIYACVMVLGMMGTLGFGVVRGLAQTEGPALLPNQLKPVNFSAPANDGVQMPPAPGQIPPITIPPATPAPEPLPIAAPPIPDMPVANELRVTPRGPAPAARTEKQAPMIEVPIIDPETTPTPATSRKIEVPVPVVTMPELGGAGSLPVQTLPTIPFKGPAHQPAESGKPASNRVAPIISIESIAPESVRYGQQISYDIVVRNEGKVAVTNVRVDEELGAGTKLISSLPAGEVSGDKALWMLGALSAGEEKRIKINVRPATDGDLNTRPRVSYTAATAMCVRINRPHLVVNVSAPEAAMIGEEVPMRIHVTNSGSGEAFKVQVKALLSDGLKHPEGKDITAEFPRLGPGESQDVTLKVQAAVPGEQTCAFTTFSEGAGKAVKQVRFDVRQPKLNLAVAGPIKCMVRSEPTFTIELSNPGNCATEPVQLAAAFPEGLDFVSASDGGTYDSVSRTIMWNLGPAAAGSKRQLTVKTKSSIAGHLAVRAVAQAGAKLHARAEAVIAAEGVPSLMFEVADLEDPIEVGKETTYEIRVANTGSTHCTNVRLNVALSEGLMVGTITSSVPYKVTGQALVFEPIAKMPVKADLLIRVKAKGTVAGDQRFKVQLMCDQFKQPVVKEESTSFFQQ